MAERAARPRVDESERAALAALSGLAGVGGKSLDLLRQAYGSLAAAAAQGGRALASIEGLRADVVESLQAAPDLEKRGAWLLAKAREIGATVLTLTEPGYPPLLAEAPSPPPVLYVLGELDDARRVAVVGSRSSDDYGIDQARRLVARLCAGGVEVVSGGAFGVDQASHERALELGGRTVAVVGTGLLKPYPADHAALYRRIAKSGAVVSEFALDGGGQPGHFPRRNRTIAGLSDAVVITRGRATSGALSTCAAAKRAGREVFAVPGRADEPLAAAPNALLSSGEAKALVTGAEVFRALNLAVAEPAAEPEKAVVDLSRFSPGAQKLLAALGPSPRHVDDLAHEAGLDSAQALVELLSLELSGLCATRPGKYFLRR